MIQPYPQGGFLILLAFAIAPASPALVGWCAENHSQGPTATESVLQPQWESLKKYRCPEWFRDAKFGVYAHWGPYSAAHGTRNTDWYSHYMYIDGTRNHRFHLKTYGPVSEFGYKDLIPSFTAADIRYTRSKDRRTLYAIALGWPDAEKLITISSVRRDRLIGREIRSAQMIGSDATIAWELTEGGLRVVFPDQQPCEHAFVFRIDLDR